MPERIPVANRGLRRTARLAIAVALLGQVMLVGRGAAGADSIRAASAAAGIAPDIRFGMGNAFQAPTRATQAGARWETVVFSWPQIQPTGPTDFVPPYPASFFTDEQSRGRTIVAVIEGTPAWAASNPDAGNAAVPANLNLAYNDANNYWGNLVERLVATYHLYVHTWVIRDQIDTLSSPDWSGTVGDYAAMLRVAYPAAKAADPRSEVLIGALSYWPTHDANQPFYLDTLLTTLQADPAAAAQHDYFDGVALHVAGSPLDSFLLPRLVAQTLSAHQTGHKNIWITSTGLAPDNDTNPLPPALNRGTLADQASYIVESYALGLANGLRRIGATSLVDAPPDAAGNQYGLLRADGSLRPAFAAYQTVTSLFANASAAHYTWHADGTPISDSEINAALASSQTHDRWVWPAAVNRVQMLTPAGLVTVLWNTSMTATVAAVPVTGTSTALYSDVGMSLTVPALSPDGTLPVPLAPSTNTVDPRDASLSFTGGPPVIVVQTGVTALPAPLVVSATQPITASPIVTASPALTATAIVTPSPTLTTTPVATLTPVAAVQPLSLTLRLGEVGPAAPVAPPTNAVTLTVASALSLTALISTTGVLATGQPLYFPATGHTLAGAFLAFYSVHNGWTALGQPRTEVRVESPYLVQWFQNGRLQCRLPCSPQFVTTTVGVATLGLSLAQHLAAIPPAPRPTAWADALYIHATRHSLQGPFLAYWRATEGSLWLGNPISQQRIVTQTNDQEAMMQLFERGELVWMPDLTQPGFPFTITPVAVGDVVLRWRGWLRGP